MEPPLVTAPISTRAMRRRNLDMSTPPVVRLPLFSVCGWMGAPLIDSPWESCSVYMVPPNRDHRRAARREPAGEGEEELSQRRKGRKGRRGSSSGHQPM